MWVRFMKFKSRIDITYLVFYLINLIVGVAIITGLLCLRIDFLAIILSVILAVEIIIVSFMFFNCYYVISGDKIKLVIGFVSLDILISEIKAVTECKNLSFSFALSKLRLELKSA